MLQWEPNKKRCQSIISTRSWPFFGGLKSFQGVPGTFLAVAERCFKHFSHSGTSCSGTGREGPSTGYLFR